MNLSFDPDQVRGFSDDVMTELDQVVRPWIQRIREHMGEDGNYQTLGSQGGEGGSYTTCDYSGRGVGFALAANIRDGLDWLGKLETGMEALSLSSAVFVEKLVAGDTLTAEDLRVNAESEPPPSSTDTKHGAGGDYLID